MASQLGPVVYSPMGAFGIKFYKALSEIEGNVVCSPFSAYTALAMVQLGARGKTEAELRNVLKLASQDEIAALFPGLIHAFKNSADVELALANKAYIANNLTTYGPYLTNLMTLLSSELEGLDFAEPGSRNIVNAWVEKVTKNNIKELFKDDFDGLTKLVLVNAVYFKGKWKVQFEEHNTESKPFKTGSGTVDVRMMHQYGSFLYRDLEKHDAQLIEIPYEGDEMSMVIILPNKENGLSQLEQSLGQEDLSEILSKASMRDDINLALPRFKIETFIDLKPHLQKLGLTLMFDEQNADLSRIAYEKLHVSSIVQKAFIEVNEEGTTAAVATGVTATILSLPSYIDFNCNHPFLYFVVFRRSFSIFGGRVNNPVNNTVNNTVADEISSRSFWQK